MTTVGNGRGFIQGGSANGRCGTRNDSKPELSAFTRLPCVYAEIA